MQKIMVELFGEAPTGEAFRTFNEKVGGMVREGQSRHRTGAGGLVLPGAAAVVRVAVGPRDAGTHLLRRGRRRPMTLSIRAQMDRMRRAWPDFRVLGATDWYGELGRAAPAAGHALQGARIDVFR